MDALEFLKHLLECAKESPKFNQDDIERAQGFIEAYETYRNPTIEHLHELWQDVEKARERRREAYKAMRKLKLDLTIAHAEHKRQRDMLIVDFRQLSHSIIEAEVKTDADERVIKLHKEELELKSQLDDAKAALEVAQDAVEDAIGRYYQLKHDREIPTTTGGYHA